MVLAVSREQCVFHVYRVVDVHKVG